MRKNLIAVGAALLALVAVPAIAGPLMDRVNKGEPIRLGFANEVPWAYPGEGNKPLGFANVFTLGVLQKMGYGMDDIEPVVTEWGGLIPGLQANRFDVITGGMYILESRCKNVAFSDPMGTFGDAFIVPKGNPKNLHNYEDLERENATLVTGAGYNIVEVAKDRGIPQSRIMTVPGPTEILAAVKAGRADAGGVTYFTAQNLAKKSGGTIDVSDPSKMPKETLNWVGIAFRERDRDFLEKFNRAMDDYLGSSEMMAAVGEYGYSKSNLPADDVTTEWVCKNR